MNEPEMWRVTFVFRSGLKVKNYEHVDGVTLNKMYNCIGDAEAHIRIQSGRREVIITPARNIDYIRATLLK